ncbi:MAG: hypothetical protein ILM98_01720 [Kiritimatiellae bacterium]|nr:hypothetical protein [Kiritimatiellia bacterium]
MKKNTSKKTGTPPAKADAPVNEADLKAAIQKAFEAVGGHFKITIGDDETFEVPIVYTYCDFPTYQKVCKEILFSKKPPENPAQGICSIGRLGIEVDGTCDHSVILVWVNSSTPFEKSLPIFVHEIVHTAQAILGDAIVNDTTGESMAYLVERETRRILAEFFHLPTTDSKKADIMAKLQALLEKNSLQEAVAPSSKEDTPVGEKESGSVVQAVGGTGDKNRKFTAGYDETFLVPLVYSYSDFTSFQDLCGNILHNNEVPGEPARAYCTFERIKTEIDGRCDAKIGLVWVNNSAPLQETLTVFIHGIVLVARDMLKDADVNDLNGEVIAYFVEKETKRIMSAFFNMPVPTNPKTRVMEELGHLSFRNDEVTATGSQKPILDRVKEMRDQSGGAASGNSAE